MRYELSNGYISKVFFGCHSGNCKLYSGTIPSGYNSLEEWADKANIRAYKIVSGNLVYDSAKDAELQKEYNSYNGNEKTIWENVNGIKINTWNGDSIQLSNMPNLYNYSGKKVRFYIKYGSDMTKVYESVIDSDFTFIEFVRDYSGSDIWHTLILLSSINSTTWNIRTCLSYIVSSSGVAPISSEPYSFKLMKVTIEI